MILEKENENVIDYISKTKHIFNEIRNREKAKLRLLNKINKSNLKLLNIYLFIYFIIDLLTNNDNKGFEIMTNKIIKLIKEFEQQYKLSIVWKGIRYKTLISYENMKDIFNKKILFKKK